MKVFLFAAAFALAVSACSSTVDQRCSSTEGAAGSGGGENVTTITQTLDACGIEDCDVGAEDGGKSACDDGDPHTSDRCVAIRENCGSVCAHVKVECDGLDPSKVQGSVCDDGDPCTADRCAVSACWHDKIGGCNSCAAKACAVTPGMCGATTYDCDGDGLTENYLCQCTAPEACDGSGVQNQCGSFCASKYGDECAAAGLPSAWAFDASCNLTYEIKDDGVYYCAGCASIPGCADLKVDGVAVKCCPP